MNKANSNATLPILQSVEDSVGWLTLNRPQLRNAISRSMWDEIPALMQRCADQGARVLVIRGEGGAFAAGADLTEMAALSDPTQAAEHWESIRSSLNAVAMFPLPTIAMVTGPCMGGGCLLATACDVRVAESGAKFSIPVAQLGLALDEASIARLVALVGRGTAAEMLFSSAILSAERAERVGLINMVTAADELLPRVLTLAGQIKGNSAQAIVLLKETMTRVLRHGPRLDEDQASVAATYISADFRKRIARVLETFRVKGLGT